MAIMMDFSVLVLQSVVHNDTTNWFKSPLTLQISICQMIRTLVTCDYAGVFVCAAHIQVAQQCWRTLAGLSERPHLWLQFWPRKAVRQRVGTLLRPDRRKNPSGGAQIPWGRQQSRSISGTTSASYTHTHTMKEVALVAYNMLTIAILFFKLILNFFHELFTKLNSMIVFSYTADAGEGNEQTVLIISISLCQMIFSAS